VKCKHCGSWNFTSLGLGTEGLKQLIAKHVDVAKVHIADKNNKISSSDLRQSTSPGHVLITSGQGIGDKGLMYDRAVVVNIDNLLTIPDYNMPMRVLRLVMSLSNISRSPVLVQTRQPDLEPFSTLSSGGKLSGFINNELKQRESLAYPPYYMYIKVLTTASAIQIKGLVDQLSKKLERYKPQSFVAFIPRIKDKVRYITLLTINPLDWPNNELIAILRSLGPQHKVTVDAQDLL